MKRTVALSSAALVAVIVLIGVWRAHKSEPVWLPNAKTWPVTPVVVDFTETLGDDLSRQIWDAVNSINDAVGCTVLTTSGETGQIHLITALDREPCNGAEAPGKPAARTWFCRNGTVDIDIRKVGHIREAYLIVQHELGHALGLAHDEVGLMSPTITDGDWQTVNVPLPTLSPKDAKALAERYCE